MARHYKQLCTSTMLSTALVALSITLGSHSIALAEDRPSPSQGPLMSYATSTADWLSDWWTRMYSVWAGYGDPGPSEAREADEEQASIPPTPLSDITQVASLPGMDNDGEIIVPPELTIPIVGDQVAQARGDVVIQGRPTDEGIEGTPEDDPASQAPDLRPIFESIANKDLERAEGQLERLQTRFPRFVAPDDLTTGLNDLRVEREIDAALEAGDPARLLALPNTYPEAFECPTPANIWRIADVIAETDEKAQLMPLYRGVVEQCPNPDDRFFAIERSLSELTVADAGLLLEIERQRADGETDPARLAELDARLAGQQFDTAFRAGRSRSAANAAMRMAQPGPAIQLGYQALNANNLPVAKRWFDRAIRWGGGTEARIGAANTALAANNFKLAQALINQLPVADPRTAELAQRVRVSQFDGLLESGNLAEAGSVALDTRDPSQATLLGWTYLERNELEAAKRWFDDALAWGGGEETTLGATTVALARQDLEGARAYLNALPAGNDRRDALMVQVDLLTAQSLYDQRAPEQAMIIIREAINDAEAMGNDQLAQQARDQAVSIQLAEAQRVYDAGDYEDAKARADAILVAEQTSNQDVLDAARLTGAWSRYQLGEHRSAADRFEPLLDGNLKQTAAEGMALALAAHDDVDRIIDTANNASPEIAETIREVGRERALQRGHVQTAAMIAAPNEEVEGLAGIGDAWVQAGVALRYSDGEAGQDKLAEAAPTLAVGVPIGRHRVAAVVRAPIIDIDEPDPGDLVGTPPPAASLARFNPTDDLFAIEPSLSWTYEGQIQPFASIGTTPLTGEVSPLPVGEIGAVYHGESGWRGTLSVEAEARRDSLLSLAGIEDPTTGESFGRVVEVGPRLQAVVPVGGGFTVSGEALTSTFVGENIEDNNRFAAGIGIGYDLGLEGFEFFAVGPSYRYDTYSNNEFFFTNGHGGYFSPQSFHRVALDANFQTNQFEDFLIRGTASVGYENVEEDGAFILPDNPGFGRFAGSENSGVAVSGLVEGAYLISPRWQLIGFAGGATASEFTEYVAGLSLRYSFGDRDSLVTRDLFPARLGFSQR